MASIMCLSRASAFPEGGVRSQRADSHNSVRPALNCNNFTERLPMSTPIGLQRGRVRKETIPEESWFRIQFVDNTDCGGPTVVSEPIVTSPVTGSMTKVIYLCPS